MSPVVGRSHEDGIHSGAQSPPPTPTSNTCSPKKPCKPRGLLVQHLPSEAQAPLETAQF